MLYTQFKLSTTKPVTPIEPNRPMLPKCYSLQSSASLWYLFSNFWKCATVGSFHELPLLVFLLTNGCNEPPLYANKSLTISSYIFLLIVSIYVIWCYLSSEFSTAFQYSGIHHSSNQCWK